MLRTLFVFAILIPGTIAAFRNRFAGLLLYLWFALFRPLEFVWVDLSSLRLSLIVGIIFVVPTLFNGIRPNLSHALSKGGLVFLTCAILAQLFGVTPAVGWYWIDFLARLLLVCLLCISLIDTREKFLAVLGVISISFGFHTAKAGLFSIMRGGARFADGLEGTTFSDNNGYALGMVMILWLLIGTAQNMPRAWIRRGLVAAAMLTAFATVSTFSRAGFVALTVSTITFVCLQQKRAFALVSLGILVLALPFVPLPEGYVDRLQTIQTYEETNETSALSRLHFWRVAVVMAADNPLGVGLFNYEAAYDHYDFLNGEFGQRRSVHSSIFQVLAETGFAGAATYYFLLIYSLSRIVAIRQRSRSPGLDPESARFLQTTAAALGASLIAFVVGGAFIALALNDLTWLTFALVASLDRLSAGTCTVKVSAPATDATLPRPSHRPAPRAIGSRPDWPQVTTRSQSSDPVDSTHIARYFHTG